MKADLYTAQVRTAASGGLAHRTAAGFVVLTSADGGDILELIEATQNDADMIDQIVATAQNDGPAAFAMLFTAGGELYLIASGTAGATIQSATTRLTMSPATDQVLVHPLSAGVNETAATIELRMGAAGSAAGANIDLQAGTIEAGWLEVAVGGATLAALAAPVSVPPPAADVAPAPLPESAPGPDAEPTPEPAPAAQAIAEPTPAAPAASPAPPAAEPTPEPTPPPPEPAEPTPAALTPAPAAPEPAPAPEPALVPAADEIAEPAPTPTPAPEPALAPAPAAPVAEGAIGPVMVLGVACSQGHHNHPDAVYCSQCGTKMGVHHTTVLLNGPRPPLGVLVVDDGTTYSLSQDLVIGREPTSHDDVVAGSASPMILTDDTLSLSRQHARIALDDWGVYIQDLGSSNGTYLSRAGQVEAWVRVETAATVALEAGDRLRVGGRIIQVELHHVRG